MSIFLNSSSSTSVANPNSDEKNESDLTTTQILAIIVGLFVALIVFMSAFVALYLMNYEKQQKQEIVSRKKQNREAKSGQALMGVEKGTTGGVSVPDMTNIEVKQSNENLTSPNERDNDMESSDEKAEEDFPRIYNSCLL